METDDMKVKKIEGGKRLYGFVHDSLQNLTESVAWAKTIAGGGSLPDAYYHLKKDSEKIDYGEPNTGLILSVVAYGQELNISPMRSLIMIIPKDGRYLIRGDQAKTMIFGSGLVSDWKEIPSGSLDDGSFKYTITATRKAPDLLAVERGTVTLAREFGVEDAKRADLWVTQEKLNGAHGNKYRASTWYRYPKRMCMYRALGFLSRDLFPEVLGGLIIFEEYGDYPDVAPIFIETKTGEISLKNRAGKEQRTESESKKVKKKSTKRDEELKVEESLEEARKAKQELTELTGTINLGNLMVKKMDEGEVFETYVKVGDIITTNYRTGPYKVEEINGPYDTVYDPETSKELKLPDGWVNFSLILSDPENPKKSKSHINHLIIKDKKIVSQINDDEIFVNQHVTEEDIPPADTTEKDPALNQGDQSDKDLKADMAAEDAGTPAAPKPEDTNPWAELEAHLEPFGKYLEEDLKDMKTKIYDLAEKMGLADLIDMLPDRKTNKKYRNIIIAAQAGRLAEAFVDLRNDQILKGIKKVAPKAAEKKPSHPGGGESTELPENDGTVEKDAALEEQGTSNKFNIDVPEKAEGGMERDFQDARKINFAMADNGIDNRAWNRIASQLIYNQSKGLTYLSVFKDKETFCKQGNTVDIHYFINQHEG